MQFDKDDTLGELAWLAFVAQQHGWDGMADRIADDFAASKERQDELQLQRQKLDAITDADDDQAA